MEWVRPLRDYHAAWIGNTTVRRTVGLLMSSTKRWLNRQTLQMTVDECEGKAACFSHQQFLQEMFEATIDV